MGRWVVGEGGRWAGGGELGERVGDKLLSTGNVLSSLAHTWKSHFTTTCRTLVKTLYQP